MFNYDGFPNNKLGNPVFKFSKFTLNVENKFKLFFKIFIISLNLNEKHKSPKKISKKKVFSIEK